MIGFFIITVFEGLHYKIFLLHFDRLQKYPVDWLFHVPKTVYK